MRLKAVFFLLLASIHSFACADEYDTSIVFQKGNWIVERTHDISDGQLWCAAETRNSQGQLFSITFYDSGSAALVIVDQRWSIPKRPIRFLIDIDYSRWTIDGHGEGIGISISLEEGEKSANFLQELSDGTAVALYNASERRLATFSLNGSSAAIRKGFECWSQILIDPDPFAENDPFLSSEDPF